MQTKIIHTENGKNVKSEMMGDPPAGHVFRPMIYEKKPITGRPRKADSPQMPYPPPGKRKAGRKTGCVPSNRGIVQDHGRKSVAREGREITRRKCMCCKMPFDSEGIHNRMCCRCSHLSED